MGDVSPEGYTPASDVDVSFVVTVFNKAPFILGMIDSLRQQSGRLRCEYIFIDDGSSDGSVERIEGATRDLPRVTIITQANAGPAVSTNVGVHHAHGRYIKLLDGDDRLVPGITELLHAELERAAADLIVGELGTYRLDAIQTSEPTGLQPVRILPDALQTVIMSGLSNTSGSMFRRMAFQAVGGCDETVFVQDFSFFLRMARGGRYLVTDSVVAYEPESATGRVSGIVGQTLHDSNRSMYNLVVSDPDLPNRYRLMAMRRAAGRAWLWSRRSRGATFLSKAFVVHLLGRLPVASWAPWILRNSIRPFYADPNLRFPGARV